MDILGCEADLSNESSTESVVGPKGFVGSDSVDRLFSDSSLLALCRSSSLEKGNHREVKHP